MYFQLHGRSPDGALLPLDQAASGWGPDQVRGPAVTAALARAAEREVVDGFRPSRATFDLLRPTRMAPVASRSVVVRQGRRLLLVRSELVQRHGVVAHAMILFVRDAATPPGRVWERESPSVRSRPEIEVGQRAVNSGGRGWVPLAEELPNAERKQIWLPRHDIVEGESPTPFQLAASAADVTNLVIHWGDRGVEYINADVTLSMSRLPRGHGIGVVATGRVADAGVSVGAATMYDESGAFGFTTVSALANHDRAVTSIDP